MDNVLVAPGATRQARANGLVNLHRPRRPFASRSSGRRVPMPLHTADRIIIAKINHVPRRDVRKKVSSHVTVLRFLRHLGAKAKRPNARVMTGAAMFRRRPRYFHP